MPCFAAVRRRLHRIAAQLSSNPSALPAMRTPITITDLEHLVERELLTCTADQRAALVARRVPFYAVPIHRLGAVESVLVVAMFPQGLLCVEDAEEGFEFGNLGEDDAIPDQGCHPYALSHVLSEAGF